MQRIFSIGLAVVAVLSGVSLGNAAHDITARPAATAAGGLEIIVLEVKGCSYCPIFRRDVLPVYLASPRAQNVPMRFLDLNAPGMTALRLNGAVTTVPTAVIMRGDREIGRITGYVGPENFQRMVTDLLLGHN